LGSLHSFRVVHVFAFEQTDGADLPELPCHRLQGDGASYDELVGYASGLGFNVNITELPGEMNGLCSHTTGQISLRSGLEAAQRTKTLVHEIAHAILHGPGFDGTRNQAEIEAESVAFIVCGALGIDSAEYSWGYLASWGADTNAIRQAGQRIQKTAERILSALDVESEVPAA
jgi:hypothetical protein